MTSTNNQDPDSDEEPDVTDSTFISNAGIVLIAPYLPRLFAMHLLTEDGEFVDHTAAERAAHLIQFAVNESTDTPEYDLVLNKLLCGIGLGRPLAHAFELSDAERESVHSLIDAVIEHWGALGHTSRAGLQSSFFQREGRLRRAENGWQLLVAERAFDLLLDRLPWNYKLIKYPWMEEVLHVDWR